jgi:hypothetical protein
VSIKVTICYTLAISIKSFLEKRVVLKKEENKRIRVEETATNKL